MYKSALKKQGEEKKLSNKYLKKYVKNNNNVYLSIYRQVNKTGLKKHLKEKNIRRKYKCINLRGRNRGRKKN